MGSERRHQAGLATMGGTGQWAGSWSPSSYRSTGLWKSPGGPLTSSGGKEGDQFKYEELFAAESLLLGRVTYQGFAAAWPNMGGDDFGSG